MPACRTAEPGTTAKLTTDMSSAPAAITSTAARNRELPATPEAAKAVGLVKWPDPRLRKKAVTVESFDAETVEILKALAGRMFEIMREEKGVGLAAPQVGVSIRLFVMDAGDGEKIYVNPELSDPEGEDEAEEGCLSLPDIRTPVLRCTRLRMQARDAEGNEIDETSDDFVTRVWQHETDHLNGVLILDKMPPSVRMGVRRQLKDLEEEYAAAHPKPEKEPPRRHGRHGGRRKKK